MRNNMRRLTALLCSLLLVLSLTACGISVPGTTEELSSSTAQMTEPNYTTGNNGEETQATISLPTEPEATVGTTGWQEPSTEGTTATNEPTTNPAGTVGSFDLSSIPAYSGSPYFVVNNNEPFFSNSDYTTEAFEYYSELDALGRCGVAYANICKELMPTEERGEIGSVKPSGWVQNKYDFVDGKYLYNRCHIIGFQLAGENANEKNLITGTRYMNVDGMLPFENMVDDYVDETENHVLYRATPVYEGDNLLAAGVLLEAWSIEDEGDGICFNVFCYNVQPGVTIDYSTGENWLSEPATEATTEATLATESNKQTYILNTNSKKFHYPDCSSVADMSEKNKQEYTGSREDLINNGYEPCKRCKP